MKPAFLTLAGAAVLSTAFAALEAAAFVAMLAVPIVAASAGDARAAGTLYRWQEPDGALTYSPTAPTDGRPYESVDPTTLRPTDEPPADTASAPPVRTAPRPPVTPSEPDVTTVGAAGDRDTGSRETGVRAAAAPTLGAAIDDRRSGVATAPPERTTDTPDTARIAAANDKERRCGELAKRVVSLERRLATPLTPAAMDDTVVQMARYQRSVERHCR